MAGADSVGSVDSSRRTLAQPEPFANSHQTTRTMTPLRKRGEEAWAAHGMAQPGRPAAIAGDGRGGQCCNRVGIKARAIEPGTAAPSGLARWRQREQGGVAWPMTSWPRRRAVRISEPRM